MEKIRAFILDSKCGKDGHGLGMCRAARELGMKINEDIEIRISEERYVDRVPRDHDIYIVHISNVRPEDIIDLKREQPWCKIVGISGAANAGENPDLRKSVDSWCNIMLSYDYKNLLETSKQKVKPQKLKNH